MRLADWLQQTTAQLRGAGVDAPQRDARLIAQLGCGISSSDLIADPDRSLSVAELARLSDLRHRRLSREPVSRIVGQRGFMELNLEISPETLDPRPDTETLVQAVIDTLRAEGRDRLPLAVADLGIGSGAILISLLQALPGAHGIGVDISDGALAIAAKNAATHGVGARIALRSGAWLEGLDTVFDVIVSNPPYIPSGDIAGLAPEVRVFDPRIALDGGDDGLDAYRCIASGYQRCLKSGGWLFLEVGEGQADDVIGILAANDENPASRTKREADIKVFQDLTGRSRCVAKRHHRRG